jgi:hypothetical protein
VPVTDPVDARLLAALAEVGKVAVHELAAHVGMDPREVAYRLVALSGSGLPLLVGVESDPQGLRAALAGPPRGAWPPPTGGLPARGAPSGAHPVHGTPSGAFGAPSGPYPPPGPPANPPQPSHGGPPPPPGQPPAVSQPVHPAQFPPGPAPRPDPVLSTWGPPQTASWARGDQRAEPARAPSRTGRIGDTLRTQGLEGEQLAVQLLEVQDPADFLFATAGHRLRDSERAVVVHTEITNHGAVPFTSLPDNYLELVTADGGTVAKAPVSLASRPPHRVGVQPGETAGGHTVYVLQETSRITSVRWSPGPEPGEHTLTWSTEE